MNRRDVLKALGVLPIAGALGGCGDAYSSSPQAPGKETEAHTLQILLEGAFAVVLQKDSRKLTAFVPQPDPGRKDLAHQFCFNDPKHPRDFREKSKGYRFELSSEGLHSYSDSNVYINPDFNDFKAEIDKWHLPPSLVVLELPFPRSITFTGRPLRVKFGKKALKPTGLMPTNYILEYRVDKDSKVRLKCDHPDVNCAPSPHCPPGVMRYFFAVGPTMKDRDGRQQHAVDFFNFMLSKAFPELAQKYEVLEIEPSDYDEPGGDGTNYPRNTGMAPFAQGARVMPAVLRDSGPIPRFLPVASLVDCQSGGLIGISPHGPTGS